MQAFHSLQFVCMLQPGLLPLGLFNWRSRQKLLQTLAVIARPHLQVCKGLKQSRDSSVATEGQDGVSVHESLLSDSSMCEHFVGLLCQFEPAAVLPFLQSYDSYR